MSKPTAYFLSEEVLKARTIVNNNVDSKMLNQTIWSVQEEYMHPALGTALYNRLVEGIDGGNLTDKEKELLNNYIVNAMVFYCLAELPVVLGFKFYNKNVIKQSSENAESASMSELHFIMTRYQNKAEFYVQRMITYLQKESGNGNFPEYTNPGNDCDTITPRRNGYTCPIVLDDTDDHTHGYDH